MNKAAQQNAMMLASLVGVGEAEAGELLARTVRITAEPGWKSSWARDIGKCSAAPSGWSTRTEPRRRTWIL
jgi:hypothetical protein